MDSGQPGIAAVLNQAEAVLVAQQLPIAEDEGVALGLGLGGMGLETLGGHGSGDQGDGDKQEGVISSRRSDQSNQMAAASPSLGMNRSASLTVWSRPRVL